MSESSRMRTAKAYLSTLATLDMTTLSGVLSDEYTLTICPATLSLPAMDKDAYISRMSSLRAVLVGLPVTYLDIIESESSNSVWIHGTAVPEWKKEAKGDGEEVEGEWDFKGEYVFMLWMDESGEKVVRCVEMVDSLGMGKMGGLFAKAMANVTGK